MLNDLTIGQYVPAQSVIHRLDPRTKLTAVLPFTVALFSIDSWQGYLMLGLVSLAVVLLSRLPFIFVLRGLKPIIFIVLLTFTLNAIFTPGREAAALGPLSITNEGLVKGIFMSLRLIYLVLMTSLLTLTTSPIRLTDGMEQLLSPGRRIGIPAHELALMMTIALRFIPTFLEETEKIMKAQKARGADFETGNIVKRGKNLVPLLVPLFISAFRRADELATAMEARCYRSGVNRTRMVQLTLAGRDFAALFVMVLVMGAALASRWWY